MANKAGKKKCYKNHCTDGAGFWLKPMRERPKNRGFNKTSTKLYPKEGCRCPLKERVPESYRCPPKTATAKSSGGVPVCKDGAKPYHTRSYLRCMPNRSSKTRCGKKKK